MTLHMAVSPAKDQIYCRRSNFLTLNGAMVCITCLSFTFLVTGFWDVALHLFMPMIQPGIFFGRSCCCRRRA